MAYLDWMKEGPTKTVESLPENVKAQAKEVGERINSANKNESVGEKASANQPGDAPEDKEALRQKANGQGKEQAQLSPTDRAAGQTADARKPELKGPQKKEPAKTEAKTQTQPPPQLRRGRSR